MTAVKLPSNIDILAISKANPEPVLDPYYEKVAKPVISNLPTKPNQLMLDNLRVMELITTWKVLKRKGGSVEVRGILKDLVEHLVAAKNINFGEFPSFWATLDISFSFFKNSLSQSSRIEFIEQALDRYLERRYDLYAAHGLTATTLQVRADSAAHKASGSLAERKVQGMLESAGLSHAIEIPKEGQFIFPDSKGDAVFYDGLVAQWKVMHPFGSGVQKYPDFAFILGDHLFVVEHKHKQEGGGGQSGAIQELIDFIEREESSSNIHYLSFMDGYLFNELMVVLATDVTPKILKQREKIETGLKAYPSNYFVNTQGFQALLSSFRG